MNMCQFHLPAPKLILAALCSFMIGELPSVAQPEEPIGALRLTSGDYVAGWLSETEEMAEFAWQHPQFEGPLKFKTTDIVGAFFPAPKDSSLAKGDFGVELRGGDLLFGTITGIDDQAIRINSDQFGEIEVARKLVRRLYRWNSGVGVAVIDCGSLDGWKIGDEKDGWSDLGGQLRSSRSGATLSRDVAILDKARISIELAWENQPNFAVALGVVMGEDAQASTTAAASAFRIEVWDKQLVAVWEREDKADIAVLGAVADFNQELRLTIDLDQVLSEATVLSDQGKVLAKIALKGEPGKRTGTGFWLENIAGSTSLNRLQVTRGDLTLATTTNHDVDHIYLIDQKPLEGSWIGVEKDEWIFRNADMEQRVPANQVLQADIADTASDGSSTTDDQLTVQLRTMDGIRLTGIPKSIVDGQLHFKPAALSSTVIVPTGQIGRLSVVGAKLSTPHRLAGGIARLETADSRLHVRLADVKTDNSPTLLRFEPVGASPVLLRPTFSGRLVYQTPPPKAVATVQRTRVAPRAQPLGFWGAFATAFSAKPEPSLTGRKAMYLQSGEVVPCEVKSIEEDVVTFKSTMTAQTQVPRDQVRALQLISGRGEPVLDQLKRERLLTVPRTRKNNPPTHLIVATNGDVMRCRLKGLTDKAVEVETRLETIEIDRKLVAQILWLDSATEAPEEENKPSAAPVSTMLVKAVLRDGNQISVVPRGVESGVILGMNDLLGECRIDTKEVRELLFGDAEGSQVEKEPYGDWRLSDAPEPIIPESSDGGRMPGVGSALVGKEAPDFTLALLGGGNFKLSEQRGKVIVLDFWATWCGPCMQAMPVIEETVASFERDDVMLVTVNLQETEEPIRATLERLKLDPKVAMDIDGVAAGRYQADAIPQTVVIDQEGKVSRLFVGGGAKLGEQLTEAIEQLIAPKQETP
jgi:thiol-disulfide isomerase/thioredoxin